LQPAGCAQAFPIFVKQEIFKPSKLTTVPDTTSAKAATAAAAVPAATASLSGAAAAGAAAKQQKAPERCDPKGYKPVDGKPLLYLYVWAGAPQQATVQSSMQSGSCSMKDLLLLGALVRGQQWSCFAV
jgi:hypothetical protein